MEMIEMRQTPKPKKMLWGSGEFFPDFFPSGNDSSPLYKSQMSEPIACSG